MTWLTMSWWWVLNWATVNMQDMQSCLMGQLAICSNHLWCPQGVVMTAIWDGCTAHQCHDEQLQGEQWGLLVPTFWLPSSLCICRWLQATAFHHGLEWETLGVVALELGFWRWWLQVYICSKMIIASLCASTEEVYKIDIWYHCKLFPLYTFQSYFSIWMTEWLPGIPLRFE